ncbi:MAG TPA: LysR family transcriptional regulator [Trueperaceae bacterium]
MAIEKTYSRELTLAQLRACLAVARTGSFSAAALDLDMSQASVSYAVAQAEQALGLKLFRRGAFGARLTDEGERIRKQAVKLLRTEEVLLQEAELMKGTLSGVVRVAGFPSIAQYLLPPVMKRLRESHPGLEIRPVEVDTDSGDVLLNSMDVLRALEAGQAELGLVVAKLSDEFIHWKLFDDPFVVCIPAALDRDELTWEDLRELPVIAYGKDWRDGCVLGVKYVLEMYGATEPAYQAQETGMILNMIAQGLGFSVLPKLTLDTLPKGVAAVSLKVPRARTASIAVPPELLGAPTVKQVLTLLRARLPNSELPPFSALSTIPG